MSITCGRPKAYLIIAFYNRKKWNYLRKDEREDAEHAADVLFPEEDRPLTDLAEQGVLLAHSFDSELFTTVPGGYFNVPQELKDLVIDGFYATQSLTTRVGWMAVVADECFSAYVRQMRGNGRGKGLWPVYDIEVIPLDEGWTDEDIICRVPSLRDDQSTQEIYEFMTPTSWNH